MRQLPTPRHRGIRSPQQPSTSSTAVLRGASSTVRQSPEHRIPANLRRFIGRPRKGGRTSRCTMFYRSINHLGWILFGKSVNGPFQQLANTIRSWSQCHFLNLQEYRCRDRKRWACDASELLFHLFSFFLCFALCFSPFIRSFTQNRNPEELRRTMIHSKRGPLYKSTMDRPTPTLTQ
jgi:hypothetical protein